MTVLVMRADVLHELAAEIRRRAEDAARDALAFDLGEPQLRLIQPGAVRRGEMDVNARVRVEPRRHCR